MPAIKSKSAARKALVYRHGKTPRIRLVKPKAGRTLARRVHVTAIGETKADDLGHGAVVKRIAKSAKPGPKVGVIYYGGGAFHKMPKSGKIRVADLRSNLGVSQSELARVTGYSLRAIAGWESGKPLSDSARKKIIEVGRLSNALSQIVPLAQLGQWMRTPNPAFEGQSPIQVIERGESDRLWRMIVQIDSNVAN